MSEVKTNKITSLASNNDITLDPDGTGDVVVAQVASSSLDIKGDRTDAQITLKGGSAGAGIQLFGSTYTNYAGAMYLDATASTTGTNDAQMVFRTGSTPSERMRIGSDGKITVTEAIQFGTDAQTKITGGGSSDADLILSGDTNIRFETGTNERMRIDSSGKVLIGQSSYSNTSNVSGAQLAPDSPNVLGVNADLVLLVNRRTNDGNLISFQQDKSEEGSISVSGTTVSYNGGHLSRWSQATDGNRIDGLVKGTVMTNLDQMAVWHHADKAATYYEEGDVLPEGVSVGDEKTPFVAAHDEDNEQLNCMAVSSVEGDTNVAGVFVNWDNDDKDFTADMNIAMTGDMVIRIAKDTTVARGDLLMSAGDGTAKSQDDDIVRSKTIAKVTSTTKSHTYDDGSYLVPCVLMAC